MSVIIDNVCSVEETMECAFCNHTKNESYIYGLLGEPRVSINIVIFFIEAVKVISIKYVILTIVWYE